MKTKQKYIAIANQKIPMQWTASPQTEQEKGAGSAVDSITTDRTGERRRGTVSAVNSITTDRTGKRRRGTGSAVAASP